MKRRYNFKIRRNVAFYGGTGKNDVLKFDLHADGVVTRQSINLDAGEYDASGLAEMINRKLADSNILVTASVKNVMTPKGQRPMLSLTYSPGENGNYGIDGIGGTAAYSVFYSGPFNTSYDGGVGISFQVGANSGATLDSSIQIVRNEEIIGVHKLDLSTREGADSAISTIDDAIDMVNGARATVGAVRNGLEALQHRVRST